MRINLSLPNDLKKAMDLVPQPVNWSAVAAEAFRLHLEKLKPRGSSETTQMAERLRGELSWEKELESEAEKCGRSFAARIAFPAELRRLSNCRFCKTTPESAALRFFDLIEPETAGNEFGAAQFWELVTGKAGFPDDEYVNDFASGAIRLWKNAKAELAQSALTDERTERDGAPSNC